MKNNWQTKKLGEICKIELGKTPYRGNKNFWDKEKQTENVWLSIADLLHTKGNVISDSKEYISDKGSELCKVVKKGTLLVSFKLTLGRLAFTGKDLYTNEAIAALSIKKEKEISKNYLYYFLSFFDWHGAVQGDIKIKGKTLNKVKLKEIEIFYPESISEQHRIVKILDEIFKKMVKAKKNVKKNSQNIKELFESYLYNVFANSGNNWEEKKLSEVCKVGAGNSAPQKKEFFKNGKYPFFRTSDIGKVKISKSLKKVADYLNDEGIRGLKFFKKGTILLPKSGASTFLNYRIIMGIDGYVVSHLATIKTNKKFLDNYFLFYFLQSIKAQDLIQDHKYPSLNISTIEQIQIPIPPLPKQRRIVVEFDALSDKIKKLKIIYKQKLEDLEELKKSVLKKAFSGKL